MKKFIIAPLLVLAMVFSIATASMAITLADVKTTSEAITGATNACEKLGSISFTFQAGSVLRDGDWWYADLPLGVTICHPVDFAILGVAGGGWVPGAGGFPAGGVIKPADGASIIGGFWTVKDLGTNAAADGIAISGSSQFWFRVSAANGGHRLLLQAFDSDYAVAAAPALTYAASVNANSSTWLTVLPDSEFTIKILDGNFHTATDVPAGPWGYNDTVLAADTVKDGVYGNSTGVLDNLGGTGGVVTPWDNTLCATSSTHTSSTVNASINSGGVSGPNFISFNPTNPEVAHMISATSISLAACKNDLFGSVSLTGGQSGVCIFDYENATGYCADVLPAVFTAATSITGNKILIQNNTGTFYDALDQYQLILQVSGNGAYWAGNAVGITGYLPTIATQCAQHAASAGTTAIAAAFGATTETGVALGTYPTGVGCAAITAASRVIRLTSAKFGGISTFNQLEVDIPAIAYDPAMFVAGGQVTVTVTLNRLPCGQIFTGTRVVAQFAAACPTAAATTRLLFPYATQLNGNDGWWFGMSVANPTLTGSVAGTATITLYEANGNVGTYTTPSVAVGRQVTFGGPELLALLTPAAANTSALGAQRGHIVVNCNFLGAGGFAMMGSASGSTGYVAYGNSASWLY